MHTLLLGLILSAPGLAAPGDLEALERDLRAPRPETRRSAVRKLAEIGTRPAWDLVVGALGDPDSQVADEAQVQLGTVKDGKLVEDLLGRSGLRAGDAFVRVRVAEALGRVPVEVEGEALARALAPAEVELSRTLCWSIERQALEKRLRGDPAAVVRALDKLERGPFDPALRAAALVASAVLDPLAAGERVAEAQAAREGERRCAALLVRSRGTEQECLTASRAALEDPEPRVRCQAIENLERLGSRAAVLALVEHMEKEPRPRLRFRILAWLRSRSGLDQGFDAAGWRDWAGKIQSGLTTGAAPGARLGPVGDTRVSFAGLNLLSDRVCFLVDFSGSTWQTKVGERTRKDVLDVRLRAALEALPDGTRFNVIPYTNVPLAWEKQLVPATKANVKRAIEWFERRKDTGKGNFFDAALLALSDPEVDTIVALTDGVPTGGRRWHLELMVELLVEANRYRKVAFDSVLVDAPAARRRDWADLAARTGGSSIVAELE